MKRDGKADAFTGHFKLMSMQTELLLIT